jgi:Ulp1 family protease
MHGNPFPKTKRRKAVTTSQQAGLGWCRQGGVTISQDDLKTLGPQEWVNDSIIMAYGNIASLESNTERYRNTARSMLLLDTRFATKLALKRGYKMLAGVAQFQTVCIPMLCF